eukprot:4871981-Prymnesium_polylepis.1
MVSGGCAALEVGKALETRRSVLASRAPVRGLRPRYPLRPKHELLTCLSYLCTRPRRRNSISFLCSQWASAGQRRGVLTLSASALEVPAWAKQQHWQCQFRLKALTRGVHVFP